MAKSNNDTLPVVAQTVMLPIGKIETNHGQIDGLPKNPRIIRDQQFEALKRSIKDNPEMLTYRELLVYPHKGKYVVSGGEWDWDDLANEWDADELEDWGLELPTDWGVNPDEFGDDFELPNGDKSAFQQMTFVLADEQANIIKQAIKDAQHLEEYKYIETMGNTNTNGNALYLIVKQWVDARK